MNKVFESLIDSYLTTNIGQSTSFLGKELSAKLKENLEQHFQHNLLKAAGIGQKAGYMSDETIRRDQIFWLDRRHNDSIQNEFLDLIESFIDYLNQTCYAGIVDYEFHYAWYDVGSFYKRHIDQFKHDQGRAFSLISYLNDDWQPEDGGQLCIYLEQGQVLIEPKRDHSVFFKSDALEHEVLLSKKPRLSITGWLKTR